MTELKTEKGLRFICIAMFISLVLSLIGTMVYLLIFPSLMSAALSGGFTSPSTSSFSNVFGALIVFSSILCLAGLGLLVLEIIGIVFVYNGREEFGPEHDSKVSTGCILLIVGFVLNFIPFAGVFGTIIFALGMVYLIVEIAREEHRRMLWIGFGFSVVVSVISQSLVMYQMISLRMVFSLTSLVLIELAETIGVIFTLLAFYGTYRAVNEGVIAPVTGPVEQHAPSIQERKAVMEKTIEMTGEAERGDMAAYLMNTLGISKGHASALQEAGYGSIVSLRLLTVEDLISIEGVNPTVARKIVGRLREIKENEMIIHFSNTFGIDMKAARAVYEAGYRTMQDLEFATIDELILMDGINPTVARKVVRKIDTDSGLAAY